jgi:ABC-type glycerol-3-phosphate transport system substrate-binding protein
VRKATGRDDLYGVGLSMAALPAGDTDSNFLQFVAAYQADYVTRDGRLVIDEPAVRAELVEALDGYTALYRRGCIPPDAAGWENYGNNKAFLERRVVTTVNTTLSIPGELRATRPEDYSQNTATLGPVLALPYRIEALSVSFLTPSALGWPTLPAREPPRP